MSQRMDDFLQAVCMTLHDMWTQAGGEDLTTEELRELNTHMEQFFSGLHWRQKEARTESTHQDGEESPQIKIIEDSNCDAPMLRSKLQTVRNRVRDVRLVLKNTIPALFDDNPKRAGRRIRWAIAHLEEPIERSLENVPTFQEARPG